MKYSFAILFAAVAVIMMASESSAAITTGTRNLALGLLDGEKAFYFLCCLKNKGIVGQNDDIAAARQKIIDYNGQPGPLQQAMRKTTPYNPADHGRERG